MIEMIEVFSTDISGIAQAKMLKQNLLSNFPGSRITFDLEDCDNILRIECKSLLKRNKIEKIAKEVNVKIKALE